MRVKALVTIGGAVSAQAGEEFELTNEAQLRDLLQQGVVQPVESNPQEVARVLNLGGEQLNQARSEAYEQKSIQDQAYAEAVDFAHNQQATQQEQEREAKVQQARQSADQLAQQEFQKEQHIKELEGQAEQLRNQVAQEKAIAQSQARQQASVRNTPSQAQESQNKSK
jgi:hypothetical protein